MADPRIVRVEWAHLAGQRPRTLGGNAKHVNFQHQITCPIAKITTDVGVTGFGRALITKGLATTIVGTPVGELYDSQSVRTQFRSLEYALWDLAGKLAQVPVYALVGTAPQGAHGPLRVPCYDSQLYMSDLLLQNDEEAAALVASQALDGAARGHSAFKIKVGRGAVHMPLEQGMRRDIRVIRAVRRAVGTQARIMIDANNGYNVNLAKYVLRETADARIYWIEEAFHEDGRLYGYLKEWLNTEGLDTLIADGEVNWGDTSISDPAENTPPRLAAWAQQGLVDVLQYDIYRPGFSRWRELGPLHDEWGTRSAPHHWSEPYGNYAACHLATGIRHFEGVEWDEATIPGLDTSAYSISDGWVSVPDLPGFGLVLDDAVFNNAVRENGFTIDDK